MRFPLIAVILACGLTASAQNNGNAFGKGHGKGNPFEDTSDTGQTVKILPAPSTIQTPGDPEPPIAPLNDFAVYGASYGVGNLLNHGGYEIPNASFQPIYWNGTVANSKDTSLKYASLSSQIGAFVSVFADGKNYSQADKSADYTVIQQYGSPVGIAPTLSKLPDFVDKQTTASSYTDSQVQAYLANLFNAYGTTGGKSGLKPSSSVIYGLYFPAGMQICLATSCSCQSFCGYHGHFAFGNTQIKYAVFPYPDCAACSVAGLKVADMLTVVTSHEVREAVTDPGDFGNFAWYDAYGYEVADKCAWHNLYQLKRPAGSTGLSQSFWVQPVWSNGGTVSASGFLGSYPAGCVAAK